MEKTVLVVGLGNMGAALAETLQGAGYDTWVWNRTKEKADILLQKGASWSENVWAAVGKVDYVAARRALRLIGACGCQHECQLA